MHIQDNVGDAVVKVGEPSKNHVKIFNEGNEDFCIELDYPQWLDLKAKVDKMFEVANTF